jgi:hypothetical protein
MPWVGDFSYLVKGLSAGPAQAEYLRPPQLRPPARLHQLRPMCVTALESRALSRLFGLLAEDLAEHEVRERIGHHVLEWLSADYYASLALGEGRGPLASNRPTPVASLDLVVIVGPIATVSEYCVRIFGRVVCDPFHTGPVFSGGRIAGAFVRGDFREYT